MIILTQIIIIAIAFAIIFRALNKRRSHSGRAWKKIGLILLPVVMIIAVIFPDITNDVASIVGVGRGADLILYATVVAFIFYVLNAYLKEQDERDISIRLGRKIAIIEANKRYDI